MYNHYLETFIAVADEGSFTGAAESLTLSPTAVMKQINMLENELDVQFFNRTHQGVKLTAGGKIIYDAALKLIAFANKQTERAREAEDQENHTIVIGTSTVCPCKSLIDIWYEISDDHPEYHIKIVPFEEDHTNTLTRLQTKTTAFDCVVSPCESKKWLEYVNILQLGMTRYCVSVPASHP